MRIERVTGKHASRGGPRPERENPYYRGFQEDNELIPAADRKEKNT